MSRAREPIAARLRRAVPLILPLAEDGLLQLVAHRRAHLLTLLGIVWGAAAIVLLLCFGAGFNRFLDVGFEKTGDRWSIAYGRYTTQESGGARPGRRIVFTDEDYQRLRASVPSAEAIAPVVTDWVPVVRTERRTRRNVVDASTPDAQRILMLGVERGRFYDWEDERLGRRVAVIGHNVASIFFGERDPIGRTLQLGSVPFEVIGVLARKGQTLVTNNDLHDNMVFVPLRAGRRVFGVRDQIFMLYFNPRRVEDVPRMHDEIRATLARSHHLSREDWAAVGIESIALMIQPFRRVGNGLHILLGLIGTITLSMAGVGVANLMITVVNERTREFAMRRACGARTSDVMLQLLVETVVVVLSGGLLGVGLGMGLVALIGWMPLPDLIPAPRILPSVIVTTFLILVGVGIAAGIVPARIAARIPPANALRAT